MNRRTALFWLASLPLIAVAVKPAESDIHPAWVGAVAQAQFRCTNCTAYCLVVPVHRGDTARSVAESVDRPCAECGSPMATRWRGPGNVKFGVDWSVV